MKIEQIIQIISIYLNLSNQGNKLKENIKSNQKVQKKWQPQGDDIKNIQKDGKDQDPNDLQNPYKGLKYNEVKNVYAVFMPKIRNEQDEEELEEYVKTAVRCGSFLPKGNTYKAYTANLKKITNLHLASFVDKETKAAFNQRKSDKVILIEEQWESLEIRQKFMNYCFDLSNLGKKGLPLQLKGEFINKGTENLVFENKNEIVAETKPWIPQETDFEGYTEGKVIYAVFWPKISNDDTKEDLINELKKAKTSEKCKSYLKDGNTQEAFLVNKNKNISYPNIEILYRDKSVKQSFIDSNEQGIIVKEHWKSFQIRQNFMNECFAKAGLSGKGLPMKQTSNKYKKDWLKKETVNLVFSELNENAKIELNENAIKQSSMILSRPRRLIAG